MALSVVLLASCSKDDNKGNVNEPDPTNNRTAQLYASNNQDGNITIYDVSTVNVKSKTLLTAN